LFIFETYTIILPHFRDRTNTVEVEVARQMPASGLHQDEAELAALEAPEPHRTPEFPTDPVQGRGNRVSIEWPRCL